MHFHFSKMKTTTVRISVLADILGLTLSLARHLQVEYMDALKDLKLVNIIIGSLHEQRDNCIDHIKQLHKKSKNLTCEMGAAIKTPTVAY